MKKVLTLLSLIILYPTFAFSGEVYGNIQPQNPNSPLRVTCPGGFSQVFYADSYSSYRIYIPQSASCTIEVMYQNKWTNPLNIFVSDNSLRYDLAIKPVGNGEYLLERH